MRGRTSSRFGRLASVMGAARGRGSWDPTSTILLNLSECAKGISTECRQQRNEAKVRSQSKSETRVLSFGDGSNGALGHEAEGFLSDVFEPETVQGLPTNIDRVAAGHYHSLAVTDDGELWAWGRNAEGQLGRLVHSRSDWCRARRVDGLENLQIRDVVGSGVVSIAVAHDGSLWSWGSSKRGQLGQGPNVIHSHLPRRVQGLASQRVSQVSLGWGHALACTEQGALYAWGYPAHGRLGFQLLEEQISRSKMAAAAPSADAMAVSLRQEESAVVCCWEPRRVEALAHRRVTNVACGMDHSLALTDDGEIYSFGDNSLGQLGRSVEADLLGAVSFSKGSKKATSIAAGLGHSLAILLDSEAVSIPPPTVAESPAHGTKATSGGQSGQLSSWGWNSASQLGRDGDSERPGSVEGLGEDSAVVEAKGGRVHSAALSSKREVWVWGSGRNGRLGNGSSADQPHPFSLDILPSVTVLQVVCGFDHSLLLVRSGTSSPDE